MILREPRPGLGHLIVGLYAWLITVSFGGVLLDILYSRLVPDAEVALNEAADLLLLIDGATFLVALAALGLTWASRVARVLVIASLVVVLSGSLAPSLLAPLLRDAGPGSGALIRIGISGLASGLACVGAYAFCRRE